MKKIYLDYAATTPTDQRVLEAMEPFFSQKFGNPSSIHSFGREAKEAIEKSREQVAKLIGAHSEEIIFTSGGSEADNMAIKGMVSALRNKGNHIIISQIEHHAVLNTCHFLEGQGSQITYLSVDENGLVNPEDVKNALTEKTILVSIMHANNEIGAIQPIAEIAQIIKEFRNQHRKSEIQHPFFHTDAVQTVGHMPVNVQELGVDLFSLSGHKFYGPKGVGALYIKKGIKIDSLIHGGEQEQRRRASTENTPGIVGLGKACQLIASDLEKEAKRLTELRDYLINQILTKIEKSRLNGHHTQRLPNNINVSIEGIEGEAMLLSLDRAGIACSTGSACSSSTLEPSHVLVALGLSPEVAHSSLRFTLGKETTKKDLDYTIKELIKVVERLRKISPL